MCVYGNCAGSFYVKLAENCSRRVVNKASVHGVAYITVTSPPALSLSVSHCLILCLSVSLCLTLSVSLCLHRSDQRKTKVKKKTSDPHFNETIYFEVNKHRVLQTKNKSNWNV